VLSPLALKKACEDVGIEAPETVSEDSEACKKWEASHPELNWVRMMRQYRKANLMLKRMEVIRDRLKPDGRFPFSMLYGGAHTLRWAGGSSERRGGVGETGFNVQNFNKEPMRFTDDLELVSSLPDDEGYEVDLRACLIAPPGKKIAISDLSQIEPRIIKWLAQDWKALELIESGMSIYEVHARQTMSWKGGNLKHEDPALQFLAKQRVLALGYGCGPVKFANRCLEFGVEIKPLEARQIVNDFKDKETGTTKLWRQLYYNFQQDHTEWLRGGGDGTHRILLPSGRELVYWFYSPNQKDYDKKRALIDKSYKDAKCYGLEPKVRKFKSDENLAAYTELGGRWQWFYGGRLLENVVQAIARDVMAYEMLQLEDEGHKVLFTVHDEAVVEVDEGTTAKEIEMVMSRRPPWALTLPIAAECHISDCYLK
jgi:DNA polymerase